MNIDKETTVRVNPSITSTDIPCKRCSEDDKSFREQRTVSIQGSPSTPANEFMQMEEAPEGAATIGVSKTTGSLKTTKGGLIAFITCSAQLIDITL
ncbi:hypothetical protein QFC19_003896 [Naganishia cerealis]|uniref:Uncharacterized protein n=1 Tax=Naganishia cerealis TaxID=610337 RepID=A0ACC2VZ47_9TREE|nr:hypothetical protein QFC19_003896 [Naganishia cerealis]